MLVQSFADFAVSLIGKVPKPGKRAIMTSNISFLFITSAIVGGAIVLIQLFLHLFGGPVGDSDLDLFEGGEADASFKLLSLQGLSGFFTMFGLVGLALLWESEVAPTLAVTGAFAAGLITTWIMSRIFQWVKGLQSSGNVRIQDALGVSGTVYTRIQKHKPGKVNVVIGQKLMTLDACTQDDVRLEQGDRVIVQAVEDDGTLRVAPPIAPSQALHPSQQ
jgi:membrane protein implicated in regulation of membrane protease activity